MTVTLQLRCLKCGDTPHETTRHSQCTRCGGILEYTLHGDKPPQFKEPFNFWRYRPVLPRVTKTVTLGEGGTPLEKAHRLAESLGYSGLYLKNETRNPTNSFKDRPASLIVSDAASRGYDSLVCATNGNHGASIAAYAAKENLDCNLILPKAVDIGKLAQMMVYDAKIVEAGETIEEAIQRAVELEKELGWYQATTELNPLAVEGLKTISYEIAEQTSIPDWVIMAMGSGATLYAIWKGFKEQQRLGIIDRLPGIIGVQAEGCSPITTAFQGLTGEPEDCKAYTEATSIRVKEPIYGELALDAIKESGGFAVAVSDEDMISAGKEIARLEGIFAEPASAAPVASLSLSEVRGRVGEGDKIVCIVTSSGLKTDDILQSLTKRKKAPRIGTRLATKEKVLRIIENEQTHGYAIWKRMGGDISLGAVYQHLTDLENRGLILAHAEGKRKVFRITDRGVRVIEALDDLQTLL